MAGCRVLAAHAEAGRRPKYVVRLLVSLCRVGELVDHWVDVALAQGRAEAGMQNAVAMVT